MKLNKSRGNHSIYKFCAGVFILFFVIFAGLRGVSFAVNLDEMILLKNSGVAENIIVSKYMVQKVKQVLTLDDMVKLQNAGFSGVSINLMSSKTGVLENPVNNSSSTSVNNGEPKRVVNYMDVVQTYPIETTTIYPEENVVIYRHEKYGHLEIKNKSRNTLSVFINQGNKSIKVFKGKYSSVDRLIKPGRSLTFRLPVGMYSLDTSKYSGRSYIEISTVGAELIFDNSNKKQSFSFMYRVLGKVFNLPDHKHHHYKKNSYKEHGSKKYGRSSKKYDNWSYHGSW